MSVAPLPLKQSDPWLRIAANAVAFIAIYTLFYAAFGGAARFYLAKANALLINNVPAIATVGLFGMYIMQALKRRGMHHRFMSILILFVAFYFIYAFGASVGLLQFAIGLYIWLYFLLGILVCIYEKEETVFKYLFILWAINVFGVILNYFVDYPWIGASYEVAGTTMDAARDWAAEGVQRLPGFSRISASAASQILLGCAYILASRKYHILLKIAVFAFSCVGIYLTTSKTEMGMLLAVPLLLMAYSVLQAVWPKTKFAFYFARTVIVSLVFLIIFLPVGLSTHNHVKMTGTLYGFITGDTMIDRMTRMWPEAFDMLDQGGNPIFGRGIGGIGTGLAMLDPKPDTVNSADNLFVYIYVEAGLFLSIPFFLSFFRNTDYVYRRSPDYFEIIWIFTVCILGLSITTATIEDPALAIFIGIIVARGYCQTMVPDFKGRYLETVAAKDAHHS